MLVKSDFGCAKRTCFLIYFHFHFRFVDVDRGFALQIALGTLDAPAWNQDKPTATSKICFNEIFNYFHEP